MRRPSWYGLAGADALGDAAPLAGRHGGLADAVEQARLAVVDVAHDGHDRRPLDELAGVVLLEEGHLRGGCGHGLALDLAARLGRPGLGHLVAQLLGDERCRVTVDGLVDGGEDAAADELADDVRGVDADELGQLLDGDRVGDLHRPAGRRVGDADGALLAFGPLARLLGPPPTAGAAATTCHRYLPASSVEPGGRS